MNRLKLVAIAGENQQSLPTDRPLTIGIGNVGNGCAVAYSLIESGKLTSVHFLNVNDELRKTTIGKPRLIRDNPFLSEAEMRALDEHGLIREGTRVAANGVLASIVVQDLRPGQYDLGSLNKGMQWVTDRTWRVPVGWGDATVSSVQRLKGKELGRDSPSNMLERIDIELCAERALQVGDLLLIDGHPQIVSTVISDSPRDSQGKTADIIVAPDVAAQLGISSQYFLVLPVAKADDRAADLLQSRNVGPYSLISLTPLAGRLRWGGQAINSAQIDWLHRRGLRALVGELCSLKSDDTFDRPLLKSLAEQANGSLLDLKRPAAPESLAEISAYLSALGLRVDLVGGDEHISVRLKSATSEWILNESAGEVKKPETIHYRTYKNVDDGLFAPNIFGPSNWARRRRFGHIQLAVPVISILWRVGSPSLLSLATRLSDLDVEQLLKHQAVLQDGRTFILDRKRKVQDTNETNLATGAAAIQNLLREMSNDNPAELREFANSLTIDVLPVLPPDLRPLILLDNGNFATSDLNDLYRRVINRNNRMKKLIELKAPQVILDNEGRQLQSAVDALFANSILPEANAVYGSKGQRLVDLLQLVHRKTEKHEKRVDWSGAARLVADATVPNSDVLVPRQIFDALRLSEHLPILLTIHRPDPSFAARIPRPHDEPVLRVSPTTSDQLGGNEAFAPVAQVHRPVTLAGRDDALRLLRERENPIGPEMESKSHAWIDSKSVEELAVNLARAATTADVTPFSSSVGLLLGGTGSTQFAADSERSDSKTDHRQASIPEDLSPEYSAPTMKQMLEVARGHLRRACLFDVYAAGQTPAAENGRIGGEPFVPPEIKWPYLNGVPLMFLGQIPLDVARAAGALPIEVPPQSMLTVFAAENIWESGPCRLRCPVFVHSIENLKLHPNPKEAKHRTKLCEVKPRIITEAPDWSELQQIMKWELDNPKPELLEQFQKEYLPALLPAHNGVKIGGWPNWIQGPDSSRPLLLQVSSIAEAAINFGDGGTIFVFVEQDGGFSFSMQCY